MKKNMKQRADEAVVEAGIAPTLALAQAYIMRGIIEYHWREKIYRVEKAGMQIPRDAVLYKQEEQKYVSRGGYKLEKGIQYFNLSLEGLIGIDIGASTGGFTDCLLQHGIQRVYAIDVGEHLLHEKLKSREDVIEKRINIKYLTIKDIQEPIDFVVADISFISLEHIFRPLLPLLNAEAQFLLLIKPQFELPKKYLHNGIVKDEEAHLQAIEKIVSYALQFSLTYCGYTPAGIKGRKGNQEYLLYFKYNKKKEAI